MLQVIPTFAGRPTLGETYAKLSHHLTECQDLAAVMSHLHRTESSPRDLALARAWLTVSENFKQLRESLITLASGRLQ